MIPDFASIDWSDPETSPLPPQAPPTATPEGIESSPGPDDLPQFKVAMQKNGHGEKKVHEAILADSRWPALRQQFVDVCGPLNVTIADTDMRKFTAWDPLGPQAQCWNEVMTRRSAAGTSAEGVRPPRRASRRPPSACARCAARAALTAAFRPAEDGRSSASVGTSS